MTEKNYEVFDVLSVEHPTFNLDTKFSIGDRLLFEDNIVLCAPPNANKDLCGQCVFEPYDCWDIVYCRPSELIFKLVMEST